MEVIVNLDQLVKILGGLAALALRIEGQQSLALEAEGLQEFHPAVKFFSRLASQPGISTAIHYMARDIIGTLTGAVEGRLETCPTDQILDIIQA